MRLGVSKGQKKRPTSNRAQTFVLQLKHTFLIKAHQGSAGAPTLHAMMMSVPIEDEDTIVSLQDVLEEDQELENTANAVLGDSDDTECSYAKV